MPAKQSDTTILLVEADVIVRYLLAEYLRACSLTVIEAASAADAKAVFLAGPPINILLSDAQLAGGDNGFALARWVRRHRPGVEIILTSSIANKAQVTSEFCARYPDRKTPSDAAGLASRIQAMTAERKRRSRPRPNSAAVLQRRRRR